MRRTVQSVVAENRRTREQASALRREAEALSADCAGSQRKRARAIRVCALREIHTQVQGARARQRLVADVLNGDRLRAVGGAHARGGKAQRRRLRAFYFHHAVVVGVRDEDIARSIHGHAVWLRQSAAHRGLAGGAGASSRNLDHLARG